MILAEDGEKMVGGDGVCVVCVPCLQCLIPIRRLVSQFPDSPPHVSIPGVACLHFVESAPPGMGQITAPLTSFREATGLGTK